MRVTVNLTTQELTQAVADYLRKKGLQACGPVSVKTIPGDRPFDCEVTTISVEAEPYQDPDQYR